MKKQIAIYLFLFLCGLFISCRPKKDMTSVSSANVKPFTVIIEKEIKGKIFGLNLNKPFGLARDMSGNIYVSDSENDRLIKFSSDMKPLFDIGGYGKQSGLLNTPTFITIDNGLNLLVADEKNRRISRYNSQLNFVEEIPFESEEDPLMFGLPAGVAFTDYGEMWVSDRENDQVVVFNNLGNYDRILGEYGYAGGQLASPEKIIKNYLNQFVVCDAGNSRLMIYDDYGNFIQEISNDNFDYPIAAVEQDENLWVLDSFDGMLYYLNKRGDILFSFGPVLLGSEVPLKYPSDVLPLDDEHLLITDTGNNRLLLCRIVREKQE